MGLGGKRRRNLPITLLFRRQKNGQYFLRIFCFSNWRQKCQFLFGPFGERGEGRVETVVRKVPNWRKERGKFAEEEEDGKKISPVRERNSQGSGERPSYQVRERRTRTDSVQGPTALTRFLKVLKVPLLI